MDFVFVALASSERTPPSGKAEYNIAMFKGAMAKRLSIESRTAAAANSQTANQARAWRVCRFLARGLRLADGEQERERGDSGEDQERASD